MLAVSRVPVWSIALPRHRLTHECIARRFADAAQMGGVAWRTTGRLGPFQFQVEGERWTFEVERFRCGRMRHRWIVSVLLPEED